MGTKTTLVAVVPRADHAAQAAKLGRSASGLLSTAVEQASELAIVLGNIRADMQAGDSNITTLNTLITNLS
jgi:hypothetical protein